MNFHLPLNTLKCFFLLFCKYFQGTYFLTTDISGLRFNGSDVEFCKHITERAGVAAIPLSVFFTGEAPQNLVRFAFCKQRPVLEDAVKRLGKYFNE